MVIRDFLERYMEKEDFFYRLRGKKNQEQLIVYYYGIKMFEVKDGVFYPTIKGFVPNSKNKFSENVPSRVLKDYESMLVYKTKFKIHYNDIETDDYEEFYQAAKSMDSNQRSSVHFVGKEIKDMTLEELQIIEDVLSYRIKLYSNAIENYEGDFSPTTTEEGKREKIYQMKLMNLLNDRKKTCSFNAVFSKTSEPLEMEYGFKTDSKIKSLKRGLFIPLGRIDNIFVDGTTINMVEIKIGTSVLGKGNGIHKHLLDIAYCVENDIIAPSDFNAIIDDRASVLDNLGLENRITNHVENIEYTIICGYKNLDERTEVEKFIHKIYKKNMEQVLKMTESGRESKSEKIKDKISEMNQEYGDLMKLTIPELLDLLNDKLHVKTNIYLATDDYKKIDPYQYCEL